MQITGLSDIGSPSAIEPLYDLWKSGNQYDHILAEALLVLCELNDVQRAELPEWRRIVEADEARHSQTSDMLSSQIRLTDSPVVEKLPATKSTLPTRRAGKRRRKRKRRI